MVTISSLEGRPELLDSGPARAGTIARVDGLPEGECLVALRHGAPAGVPWFPFFDDASRDGSAEDVVDVSLVADSVESVVLALRTPREPRAAPAVPLAGTIEVPEGYDLTELELRVDPFPRSTQVSTVSIPFERWRPVDSGNRRFAWSAGDVAPGSYALEVNAADCAQPTDVGAQGRGDVELKLPPRASGILRLVDEATGKPVDLRGVHWIPLDRVVGRGSSNRGAGSRDFAPGTYPLKTHAGPGHVLFFDDDWVVARKGPIELEPGEHDVTVLLRRACGIVLRLVDGATEVPWDDVARGDVAIRPAEVSSRSGGLGGPPQIQRPRFQLASPGRIEITLPRFRFYRPVPPFEVEVPPGEVVTHTVELVRLP